jgi:steroid delta-isomerase-like uncharacterized protein
VYDPLVKGETEMLDNKAIVTKIFDALWSQGQFSMIDELVSKDFVGYWPFRVEPVRGPVEYKGLVADMRKVFPALSMKVLDYVSGGEKAVARFEVTGTHRAEFLTVPPTQKSLTVEGLTMFRIANGKIVETRVQMDLLTLLRGLGIVKPEITMHAPALIRYPLGASRRLASPKS